MARTLIRGNTQIKPGSLDTGIKKEVRLVADTNVDVTTGGVVSVDGQNTATGDRILLTNQTTPAENGIWVAAAGAWARADDADELGEVFGGELIGVGPEGTDYDSTVWINATTNPITPGTTAQSFIKVSAAQNPVEVSEFIVSETPGGTINGSNTAFTLANTPEVGTERIYHNGQRLKPGASDDYTISGVNITLNFAPKAAPGNTDVLLADYIKA